MNGIFCHTPPTYQYKHCNNHTGQRIAQPQLKKRIIRAAIMAPTDPSRSPITCKNAARIFKFSFVSPPRMRIHATRIFTSSPIVAMINIPVEATSGICKTLIGLIENVDGNQYQSNSVKYSCKNFKSFISVCFTIIGRFFSKYKSQQTDT